MTRRIPSLLLLAVALPALTACDGAGVIPSSVRGATDLQAPSQQESSEGSLFMKWLTRPPSGVNGLKGAGE